MMANLSVLCKLLHVAVSPHEKHAAGGVVVHVPLPHAVVPTHKPGIGDLNITLTRVSAAASLDGCSAAGGNGVFDLDTALTVNLTHVDFEYRGTAWPHVHDTGSAEAEMVFNQNISFDVNSGESQFAFKLLKPLKISLHQTRNDWVTEAIAHMLSKKQTEIAEKVTAAGRAALARQVKTARDRGACALLEPIMHLPIGQAEVALRTPPEPVHVPVVGMVNVSVNSTEFYPVETFACRHLGFDGRTLDTELDETVAFDFNWTAQYTKERNNGTGRAHVNATVSLRVDLVTGVSKVRLGLPALDLKLDAARHTWLYHALVDVASPALRHGLETFGSRRASAALSKCLADPACPHVAERPRPLLAKAALRPPAEPVTALAIASSVPSSTCSLYQISDGTCGQSDLDCKYSPYAKKFRKGLQDGTCADHGYSVKSGTKTLHVPAIGDIVITTYTKEAASVAPQPEVLVV